MSKKTRQLEPQQQIVAAFEELQKAMLAAQAAINRVAWLKDRLLQDFAAMQKVNDDLEIYTEAQAAALFHIEEKTFAEMRRRMDFPNTRFGNIPRYTKTHLNEICLMLEVNKTKKAAPAMRSREPLKMIAA